MSRSRVLVGLLLACLGASQTATAGVIVNGLAQAWPYLIAAFAAFSGIVAVIDLRRLTGAIVVGSIGGIPILLTRTHITGAGIFAAGAIVAGLILALSGRRTTVQQPIVALAWTIRLVPRAELPAKTRATCILGNVHLDLRDTTLPTEVVISVVAVLGQVRLCIPAHWRVVVDDLPSSFISLDGRNMGT